MEHHIRTGRLYWKYHRRWYLTAPGRWRLPSRVGRKANATVHAMIDDLPEFPALIEALVATAPGAKDLPLIGIDVLQEAYHRHGSAAFDGFAQARLLPEHRALILSGVWPSTLRQAGVQTS